MVVVVIWNSFFYPNMSFGENGGRGDGVQVDTPF